MRSILVDKIDRISCINLDKRPDRWEKCKEEFNKVGLTDYVERFPGIEASPGIKGCSLSHYSVIKQAKLDGCKSVLVFEDDVEFIRTSEFEQVICNAFNQMESLDINCDMFYLGGNVKGNNNFRIDTNLVELNNVKCAHAYIVFESIYDVITDIIEQGDIDSKFSWNGSNYNRLNLDYRFYRDISPNYNVYGVYPMLAKQSQGFSDVNGGYHDYKLDEKWEKLTYGK